MSILDRLSMLIRSNVNDLLDRAEDPEKTIDQIIRDMADAINGAKAEVAETITQRNVIEANLVNDRKLSAQWGEKAALAVQKGADDLAREALRRKRDYEANAGVYEHQLASQTEIVDRLKSDLTLLQSRYQDLVRRRGALIARHRTARAQQKVQKTAAALSSIDPTSELARMEEKIRLEEARARASVELVDDSLDRRFAALEGADDVESELAALKASAAPQALPPGGSEDSAR